MLAWQKTPTKLSFTTLSANREREREKKKKRKKERKKVLWVSQPTLYFVCSPKNVFFKKMELKTNKDIKTEDTKNKTNKTPQMSGRTAFKFNRRKQEEKTTITTSSPTYLKPKQKNIDYVTGSVRQFLFFISLLSCLNQNPCITRSLSST